MKGDLTVKCYLCKQSEAVFSADCLVVDYKSEVNEMQYMGQVLSKGYTMTETGGGVAVAGLCPACMKKASRHISHEAGSSNWITSIVIVVGLIGFIACIYGFYQVDRYDVPLDQFLKTPASTPFVVGGAAAIVFCFILLGIDVLLAPGRVRKNAPWKLGKGDVVRELADACREEGLQFAVYLSPWDRNHPDYGRPEYVTYFRNQLRELLTQYGDIFEVWFDGANGGDGWYGGANETRTIDGRTYYGWAETFRMIRELQPRAVIWNDGGDRGDLRWVGTEAGNVGETNWSLMPSTGDTPYQMLHYGVEDGDVWCPGETNTSIRPGWFYHTTEDEHVKSLSKLMDTYYKSVGRNSTLLLNFPIAPNGRIHPTDSLRGIAFRKMIDDVFIKGQVAFSVDTLSSTCYTLNFKQPVAVNRFLAEEDIALGQRVRKFMLEAFVDGQWMPLKDELVDHGDGLTTIGHRRIICFPTITATKLRFTITDAKCEPVIKKLGVYLAPVLTGDIPDSGEKKSSGLHIFFGSPKQMFIDWDMERTVSAFRYLPPQDTQEGIITHYTLWGSTDWGNWTKLASGEFSNIVNNPIWQTIKFSPTNVRVLRFEADRLTSGERMGYGDIEIK